MLKGASRGQPRTLLQVGAHLSLTGRRSASALVADAAAPERKAQSLPSHSFFFFPFFLSFLLPPFVPMLKKPGRFRLRETQMPFAASSSDPISNIPVFENKTVYEVDGEL